MLVTDAKSTSELSFYLKNKRARAVICLFSVKWCGYCTRFRPTFEQLAERHKQYHFVGIDCDNFKKLADQLNIKSMPTIIIFKDGRRAKEMVGGSEANIEEWISHNDSSLHASHNSPQNNHHHHHQPQQHHRSHHNKVQVVQSQPPPPPATPKKHRHYVVSHPSPQQSHTPSKCNCNPKTRHVTPVASPNKNAVQLQQYQAKYEQVQQHPRHHHQQQSQPQKQHHQQQHQQRQCCNKQQSLYNGSSVPHQSTPGLVSSNSVYNR